MRHQGRLAALGEETSGQTRRGAFLRCALKHGLVGLALALLPLAPLAVQSPRIVLASSSGSISTVAGNGTYGYSGDSGPATSAEINDFGITTDRNGNLLIADRSNNRIRAVAARNGTFYGQSMTGGDIYTVVPGTDGSFEAPENLGVDGQGNVVFTTYCAQPACWDGTPIVEVLAESNGTFWGQSMTAGNVYRLAGTGSFESYGSCTSPPNGTAATSYTFAAASGGLAMDSAGNAILANECGLILVVANVTGTFYGQSMTAGDMYTIAGTGTQGYSGDGGPATSAELANILLGAAIDRSGNVMIADSGNNRVRVIAHSTGNFYGQSMSAGDIYTIAGTGTQGYSGDGGPGGSAELNQPAGLTNDGANNLVLTDLTNNRVRVVAASSGTFYGISMTAGDIYSIAGNGTAGYSGDGGSPTSAELNGPRDVAIDQNGNVDISDELNYRVRSMTGVAIAPKTASGLATAHVMRHQPTCTHGLFPVNCASGDFWHTFTDLSVPARGPGLTLTRTYNSLSAGTQGIFGYGWSSSFDIRLSVNSDGSATVTLEDGSQVTAQPDGSGGYVVPPWADSSLVHNGDGTWTFLHQATTTYKFNSSGQLTTISDLNGYATNLAYSSGQLTSATDSAGRVLAFAYGSNGLVSQVTDPMNQVTKYAYDGSGNLTSVTDPLNRVTSFTYDSSGDHLLLTMTQPNGQPGGPDAGAAVTNTYDAFGRVLTQTDPAGLRTTYSYSGDNYTAPGGTTTITDPHGNVETQSYSNGELIADIKAAGTSIAATTTYTYDPISLGPTSITDPDSHTTTYSYDQYGNTLAVTDALNKTTTYTYNSSNQPLSITDPMGIVTAYTYDGNGNILTKKVTGAGGSPTLTTTYTYGDANHPGDLTQVTDPNGNVTTYTYDTYGDRVSATTAAASGTTSATSTADNYTYTSSSAPVVTSVSPNAGTASGGNTVTVTGANLNGATAVDFGSAPASNISVANSTSLTATAPSQPAITAVQNTSSESVSGSTETVTLGSNVTSGDSLVLLFGNQTNAVTVNSISGGGVTWSKVNQNNDSATTADTEVWYGLNSPGGSGTTTITLNLSGTATFTYPVNVSEWSGIGGVDQAPAGIVDHTGSTPAKAPSITPGYSNDLFVGAVGATAALSGAPGGGYTALSTGASTHVGFGELVATDSAAHQYTQGLSSAAKWSGIAASFYPAPTVDVTVTTAAGTSGRSSADHYTYATSSGPIVGAISPNVGPVAGGNTVTVTGANLSGATSVKFGSASATNVAVNGSGNALTATAPAAPPGSIAAVQNTSSESVSGATETVTLGAPVTAGDSLVLLFGNQTNAVTVSSVSGGGVNWTKANQNNDSATTADTEVWYGLNASGGTGTATITLTLSGTATFTYPVNISEWSGIGGLDQRPAGILDHSGSTPAKAPITTGSRSGELLVGAVGATAAISGAPGGGYSALSAGASTHVGFAELLASDTTSHQYAQNLGASAKWSGIAASFYPAVSATMIAAIQNSSTDATSGTTETVTLGSNVAAGDGLVLMFGNQTDHVTVSSVSGGGVSWTKANQENDSSIDAETEIWYGLNSTGGAGTATITLTLSGTPGFTYAANVSEWSGIAGLDAIPAGIFDNTGSSPAKSPLTTSSYRGDLFLGAVAANTSLSGSPNGGFTKLSAGASSHVGFARLVATDASAHQYTQGLSTSATWSGVAVAFAPSVPSFAVDVTVTTAAGTSQTSGADRYTYTSSLAPIVTSVSPNVGTTGGSNSVTITGANFTGATQVKFGTVAATSFSVQNASSIIAVVPAETAGTVDVTVTDGSATTTYAYDVLGRLLCEVSANAVASGVACPAAGQPRVANTTTWVYDADGEITAVTDADGNQTQYAYDANGNRTQGTDPMGNVTRIAYDADNRTTTTTAGYGTSAASTTTNSYDIVPTSCPSAPTGTAYCTERQDGLSNTTISYFDALDHMIEQAPPNTSAQTSATYTYDGVGNVLTVTNGAGTSTSTYDADNRLTQVSYSNAPAGYAQAHTVTYQYDADGERTQMVDGTGTTTYVLDSLERLQKVTDGANNVVTYGYDADNNLTCLSYPNSGTTTCQNASSGTGLVSYLYNANNQVTQVSDWLGNSTNFAYDSDKNLMSTTLPSGTNSTISASYDNADALTDTSVATSGTRTDLAALTRNANEMIAATTPATGSATTYAYDSLNRVTTGTTASYTYDAASRLSSIGPSGGPTTDFAYNTDGQLCWSGASTGSCASPPSGATSYTYDNSGDRITTAPSGGNPTTYGWDQANNMTCETAPNTSGYTCANQNNAYTATFAYNGDGLRMSDTPAGGSSQTFTWDVSSSPPRLLKDGTNYYIYGPNVSSAPVEQISISGSTPSYLVSDSTGVREQIGPSGSVIGSMSYDTFGNRCQTCSISTPFGFAGGYSDPTGLIYLIHRYYDPATGQFLSVDPAVHATGAPYSYVLDDPVNATDPIGMVTCTGWLGWVPGCGTITDAQNAVSGAFSAAWHAVVDNAAVISTAAGIAAFALGPVPVVGEVASPILGAVSVVTGAIAVQTDFANDQYLQGALDTLGTLIGAGGLGGDVTSQLVMRAAVKAWDAGEAVVGLAKTAANAKRIGRMLDEVSTAISSLSVVLAKSC